MDRYLPLLLLLFVGSGAAALIYEIVWLQMLELFVGSSTVSVGVLLGTFMGGMCLGSLWLPRAVAGTRHPLRVYAGLELTIGAIGLLLLLVMPLVGRMYTSWGGYGVAGFLLRGLTACVCLLPPTIAMGATLPAIAGWIESTPQGVSWLGFFYAGNIAGAVFGSVFAGFYLLREYDMAVATSVAAGLNAGVGAGALLLASHSERRQATTEPPRSDSRATRQTRAGGRVDRAAVYLTIALSGFCALAAEVIWTRTLGLLFGPTAYTFSIILAVFLTGLAIGSAIGSILARKLPHPRLALGWCQILNIAAIAWTAHMLSASLPYWPVIASFSTSIWFNFQLDFLRAVYAVLPGPMLWGASFPLALGALARRSPDSGRLVGGVYAANTAGAIVGSLGASLLLVSWIGSQHAQQLLILVSALAGVLVLPTLTTDAALEAPHNGWAGPLSFAAAVACAGLLVGTVPAVSGILVAYGRFAASWVGGAGDIFYVGEGLNSSVAVSRLPNGVLNYHNAGKVQASTQPQDMRLQRMLGHLTTLVPKSPRSALVIGCGSGVTAGAVSIDPRVEHVRIVEIEPLVPRVVSTYFKDANFDVVNNPKVSITIDDARHYLLTTREKFDVITSDPEDPWVKGAATLYTKEFFELARRHLNPGGAVTVWLALYETSPEAVKTLARTFFDVFPNGTLWGNTHQGKGYDTVLLGQAEPTRIDVDEVEARLRQPGYDRVARSLREVGINSAIDLFANYGARGTDLTSWLSDAPINRDRDLRLQYLAGLGLNTFQAESIYAQLVAHKRFPDDLFTGSQPSMQALRTEMARSLVAEP